MYNYSPYGYNQFQPQMDRLQQLQNMQQNQPIQQSMQQPIQQGNIITPVGNIEEVKAFNNYFDGQPHYFIDSANNKIYIKQLGINGMPSIATYSLDNTPANSEEGYCTKEEYNALKSDLDNYKGVLDNLLKQLGGEKNE